MPEHIDVDIASLDFGKAVKVGMVPTENFEIMDVPQASIAVVEIPRALRGKMGSAGDDEEEEAEAAESTEAAAE